MKVLLGMSGGIDSSMAALLLQQQGYEVIGVSFRFLEDDTHFQDAANMAHNINITHFVLDARTEFSETVIYYFRTEYLAGRTPFPCAKCNNELKWRLIFEQADRLGCEYVSMGHYVGIVRVDGYRYITEGCDKDKDQSFFLWGLTQEQLKRIVFPLGKFTKAEVKLMATNRGYTALKEKKESMGACFCGGDYRPYLRSLIENPEDYFKQGNFVDEHGKVLGTHSGYPLFTVGQRRGFGLQLNKAMFVKEIHAETNEVVLATLNNMYRAGFELKDYHLSNPSLFTDDFYVNIRIRYRKQNNRGRIWIVDANRLGVELLEPLESIAPGQTAVFYHGDMVVGGGFIV